MDRAPERSRSHARGQVESWPAGPADPLDRRIRRSGLEGQPHPGAVERRQPADRPVRRHEDRPDQLLPDDEPGRSAIWHQGAWLEIPGAVRTDGLRLPPKLREEGLAPVEANDAVDWSIDLGGGTRVSLI